MPSEEETGERRSLFLSNTWGQRQRLQHPELIRQPRGDDPADCAHSQPIPRRVGTGFPKGSTEPQAGVGRSRGQPLTTGCGPPTSLARVSYKREQGSQALLKVSPWPWPGAPSQGARGAAFHGGRGPGLASLNPASYPAADCPRDPGNALGSPESQALICDVAVMTR